MDDVYAWEQVRSQGLVLDVDHPAYGSLAAVGLAAAVRRQRLLRRARARVHLPRWPLLGEHEIRTVDRGSCGPFDRRG